MSANNLLLAVIAIASLLGLYAQPALIQKCLFRPYWLLPRRQYLTLLTSGFVHANVPHLLFNALTLWSFGSPLERAMGTPQYLALYFVCLFVSDWGTWIKHHANPDYASLGASGAILGVLFASIVYFPTQSISFIFLPIPIPGPLFAVGYLAYTWYASRQARGNINHDAHFSGALAGLAFVALFDPYVLSRAVDMLLH